MAAEFYHKTSALFEEFKKRELQSLNANERMKSSLNWMKCDNEYIVSSQDYLQKIKKREKEREQAYRELMMKMEDLDKQTDQMSLKLEKLHALRNVAISSYDTVWPSVDDTFDRPLQSYYNRSLINNSTAMPANPTFSTLHSVSADKTLPNYSSLDESTQTADIICPQCQFPLAANHISKFTRASTNMEGSAALIHKMYETHQNPSEREIQSIPSIPINIIKESHSVLDQNTNPNFGFEKFPLDVNISEVIPSQMDLPPKEKVSTEIPSLQFESVTEVHRKTAGNWSKTDDNIDMKEKESADENTMESTGTVEHAVSKSDDESMNHEFDFLESDKRSNIRSDDTQLNIQNASNENNLGAKDVNVEGSSDPGFQETSASSVKVSSVSVNASELKTKMVQGSTAPYQFDSENMERIKISQDLKPDSSVSEGQPTPPFHSENASLASESDSFSEKETPLTATAAYQALLNNVSATKTAQIRTPISESDTEDEIENALATAVRKSSNVTFEKSGPSLKAEGRKESISEAKLKTETKAPISSNKPQTKLSKSTRKVLGLDTSSGSEVELAVKTNLNKTVEDSDEFDFYD